MAKKTTIYERLQNEKKSYIPYKASGIRYSISMKMLMFLITLLICSFLFIFHIDIFQREEHANNLTIGIEWKAADLIAEYSFPVYKTFEDYEKEMQKASDNALQCFIMDTNSKLKAFYQFDIIIEKLKLFNNTLDAVKSKNNNLEDAKEIYNYLSDVNIKTFSRLSSSERKKTIANLDKIIKKYLILVYKNGFINIARKDISKSEIKVKQIPSTEIIYQTFILSDSSQYIENAKQYIIGFINESIKPLALELLIKNMYPNLIYSKELSDKEKELEIQSISRTEGYVKKGTTIIAKGDKINKINMTHLQAYNISQYKRSENIYTYWYILGGISHSFVILLIITLYLFLIRKKIFYDNVQMGILSIILIISSLLTWITVEIPSSFPIEYIVLIPALSMLSAIVFDSRTTFYVTVSMALMFGGIRGSDYDMSLIMLLAGMLAAYSVRDIQSRTQMFKSTFFIFIGFLISIVGIGIERSSDIMTIANKLIIALINSTISPFVTFGLLLILERTTNITTDLRLQEYENLNHPLLLRLNELAPGTFQHTQGLAILAERCASAINANPLLTKVGAYFHDIGKLAKPEYFAENQRDDINKHEMISPRKSAEAIKYHVVEGVRLAKEYKLPQRIIDFIPMHHGTTLIKHFYAKAIEEAENKAVVNEEDFRYPGPKPNIKECAIVMICDSAEAISRISSMTKERLEKEIDNLIKERFLDGQFDECNLNLKELKIIQDTCVRYLIGSSHTRLPYKEIPKQIEKKKRGIFNILKK